MNGALNFLGGYCTPPYGIGTRPRPPATPSNLEGELVTSPITMNGEA